MCCLVILLVCLLASTNIRVIDPCNTVLDLFIVTYRRCIFWNPKFCTPTFGILRSPSQAYANLAQITNLKPWNCVWTWSLENCVCVPTLSPHTWICMQFGNPEWVCHSEKPRALSGQAAGRTRMMMPSLVMREPWLPRITRQGDRVGSQDAYDHAFVNIVLT